MRLLAVDCSSENLSFCATDGDAVIFNRNRRLHHGASRLIASLQRSLKKHALAVEDFDAFVVGSGPGSFTGLRISFSAVKAFALATQRPVISLESFYACAYAIRNQAQAITVIADARKNLLYRGRFISKNGVIVKKGKTGLISPDELYAEDGSLIVTAQAHLRKELWQKYPHRAMYDKDVYPQARFLIPFAEALYKKEQYTALDTLQPLYIHAKTCQIRKAIS